VLNGVVQLRDRDLLSNPLIGESEVLIGDDVVRVENAFRIRSSKKASNAPTRSSRLHSVASALIRLYFVVALGGGLNSGFFFRRFHGSKNGSMTNALLRVQRSRFAMISCAPLISTAWQYMSRLNRRAAVAPFSDDTWSRIQL